MLGRWGSPLPPGPDLAGELSPDALIVALLTTFDPLAADGLRGTVQVRLPDDAFHLAVDDGKLSAERGEAGADATLRTTARTVQDLAFAGARSR